MMRRLILLAAFAASFALYGSGAIACANADHVNAQPATVAADAGLFFEQAAPASPDHHAHHHHRSHEDPVSCDGACCGCAASAAAALPAAGAIDHPAALSASHRRLPSHFSPRQLSGEFYGPPKSFA
jgi:hypothetical protein